MSLLLSRLSFLHFSKRLLYPAQRYRHGTAVEPTGPDPGKNDVDAAVDGDLPLPPQPPSSPPSPPSSSSSSSSSPSPSSSSSPQLQSQPQQPLNLTPGEWVHHFDTYSLAKHLEGSGFRNDQAVTIMKGIRGLLNENLEFANESLVSRSGVENESYLFHAACSELRGEIQHTRKTHIDHLRADGAAIQQEYDLLNQKFLEDMMSLKDELNGLFNDRKMVTRAEQRAMENKIQELNYKITVLINSDLRSEIEKLRWTTTRRGLIAIAALAIFVVSSIRISRSGHNEKKRKSKEGGSEDVDFGGPGVGFVSLG